MENDPTIEFDHFLGEQLGKTLEEVRAMDNAEYLSWGVYYGRQAQRQQIAAHKRG